MKKILMRVGVMVGALMLICGANVSAAEERKEVLITSEDAPMTETVVLEEDGDFVAQQAVIEVPGDILVVKNAMVTAILEGNTVQNDNSERALLRAEGESFVDMVIVGQEIRGDVVAEDASSVNFVVGATSYFRGKMSGPIQLRISAGSASVVLENDVDLILLENEVKDNSNIYSNGYKLSVNGEEVAINTGTPPENLDAATTMLFEEGGYYEDEVVYPGFWRSGWPYVLGAMLAVIAGVGIVILIRARRKKDRRAAIIEGKTQKGKHGK